jgi:pimeloyl-ACP methyl ester carboxylesterase
MPIWRTRRQPASNWPVRSNLASTSLTMSAAARCTSPWCKMANAGTLGSYVLVGHSAGGLNMFVFAATYPDETGGLLLLDSTYPDQFTRYPPKQAQSQKRVAQFAALAEVASRLCILHLVNGPRFLQADELEPEKRAALQAYFASPGLAAGMKAEMAAGRI